MITKLVENKKRKAHQYWPEDGGEESPGPVLGLGGEYRVEHLSTSYQGSYHLRQGTTLTILPRKFMIWLPDGGIREVTQLQTEEWPDLTAPKEPR